ncbi:hypothetical protein WAI453_002481 [Rhynchosporium graminicola]
MTNRSKSKSPKSRQVKIAELSSDLTLVIASLSYFKQIDQQNFNNVFSSGVCLAANYSLAESAFTLAPIFIGSLYRKGYILTAMIILDGVQSYRCLVIAFHHGKYNWITYLQRVLCHLPDVLGVTRTFHSFEPQLTSFKARPIFL